MKKLIIALIAIAFTSGAFAYQQPIDLKRSVWDKTPQPNGGMLTKPAHPCQYQVNCNY